ncbi:hypothetical protein ASPVEDRAFT_360556 [Aspergillus versicolor CBS 583.65]|uniref:Uncharacterized protein n=1 Tax=Aspergillus versicolor CBS 583.65 TaxID=1036611 RepID=A0A1L9Q095_ASPVE|nr:uncharacterized protein ASPVEDRAFT_360556 [Aspergillus versicolor CBS 583.65]OJJ07165.1 hypothetical protein ASPVEDRAFT_360556 [Aspergillus versicolor CBS 583.65]
MKATRPRHFRRAGKPILRSGSPLESKLAKEVTENFETSEQNREMGLRQPGRHRSASAIARLGLPSGQPDY